MYSISINRVLPALKEHTSLAALNVIIVPVIPDKKYGIIENMVTFIVDVPQIYTSNATIMAQIKTHHQLHNF